MKILTVSIAAYNAETFIRKALDSLIRKDCMSALEIFIIDDGGKDQTLDIAMEYAKKYPESIFPIHKENGGWGSTVNYSIEHATGKYLRILDADDWVETENLPKLLAFLDRSDADIVLSPYYEFREKTNEKILIDHHSYAESLGRSFILQDIRLPLMMHEMIVRVEPLRRSEIKLCEKCFYTDNEFLFCALQSSNLVVRYAEPIYDYRIGREGQSVSLSGLQRHYKELIIVSESMYKRYSAAQRQAKTVLTQLQQLIIAITGFTYRAFLLLEPTQEHQSELKEWDKRLRFQYTEIYAITQSNKAIWLIRLLHFHSYKVLCLLAKYKYVKKE